MEDEVYLESRRDMEERFEEIHALAQSARQWIMTSMIHSSPTSIFAALNNALVAVDAIIARGQDDGDEEEEE